MRWTMTVCLVGIFVSAIGCGGGGDAAPTVKTIAEVMTEAGEYQLSYRISGDWIGFAEDFIETGVIKFTGTGTSVPHTFTYWVIDPGAEPGFAAGDIDCQDSGTNSWEAIDGIDPSVRMISSEAVVTSPCSGGSDDNTTHRFLVESDNPGSSATGTLIKKWTLPTGADPAAATPSAPFWDSATGYMPFMLCNPADHAAGANYCDAWLYTGIAHIDGYVP